MLCPNKNNNNWKELVNKYGEGVALFLFTKNNYDIPSLSKASEILKNKINYQLNSLEGKIVSEKTIKDIASRMSERIGIPVIFESDRTKNYKGKIENNKAIINLAYATMDTPIHEILGHPILRVIKDNNKTLYSNLVKELEYGVGKEVFNRIKKDYVNRTERRSYGTTLKKEENSAVFQYEEESDAYGKFYRIYSKPVKYSLEEQQEEAIVELMSLMVAEKLDAVKDGKLISLLKRLLKEIASYVRNLLGSKEIEIEKLPDNMTLNDIADVLAYSNNKLILPGYEVVYTTPDNQKFKTYGEASNHISNLAKSSQDFDVNNIQSKYKNVVDPRTGKKIKDVAFTYARDIVGDALFGSPVYGNHSKEITITYEDGSKFSYSLEDIQPDNIEDEKTADFYIKLYKNSEDYIYDFIEKNKEYEQSKEIIEEWKKINGISYNPEEVYSRGQEFVSVVGAYSNFDIDLMMQNLLQHIEDNKKAGGQFAISAFTKPVNMTINHLESGGGKIKFKIYPSSEDILWAANKDVYSGSVWDASEKVNKNKKSELLGVSYTKYPSLSNINSVQPNLASIIDDLSHHHNELGIVLTGKNFRLEYDEDIPISTKKIINSINSILDEKFGKIKKPNITPSGKYNIFMYDAYDNGSRIDQIFDTNEDAKKWILKNESEDIYYIITRSGIKPTITSDNIKKDISDIEREIGIEDTDGFGNFGYYIGNMRYVKNEDGTYYKSDNGFKTSIKITEEEYESNKPKNKKEYTSQALINKKISALKEVAKKYPRSLIKSEVIKKVNTSNLFIEDDLPFQKIPSTLNKIDGVYNKFLKKLGVDIQRVNTIFNKGSVVDNALAKADIATKTIQVVEGWETPEILGEEAAHFYVALLKDTELKQELEDRVDINPLRKLYPDYSEQELLDEAVAREIVKEILKPSNWWSKFIDWLKQVFVKDNPFQKAAKDIRKADLRRLDINKEVDSVYYHKNTEQQRVAKEILSNPLGLVLNQNPREYKSSVSPNTVFTSVTTAIHGKKQIDSYYDDAKDWGNIVDNFLQQLIDDKEFVYVPNTTFPEEAQKQAWDNLHKLVLDYKSKDCLLLTQVIVGDLESKIAGSIDLVVIYPDCSIEVVDLKTKSTQASTGAFSVDPSSKLYNPNLQRKISSEAGYKLQVNMYIKLLQKQGVYPSSGKITYVLLNTVGDKKSGVKRTVISASNTKEVKVDASDMIDYVNLLIPGDTKSEPLVSNLSNEEAKPEVDDNIDDLLFGKVKNIIEKLDARVKYMEKLKSGGISSAAVNSRAKHIENTKVLLENMRTEISVNKNRSSIAYGQYLRYVEDLLLSANSFFKNKKNSEESYITALLETRRFIENYQGLTSTSESLNPEQKELALNLMSLMQAMSDDIKQRMFDYVSTKLNEDKKLTDSEIKDLIENQIDISWNEHYLSDPASTKSKLVALVDKLYREARIKAKDQQEKDSEKILEAAEKLKKAGTTNYDFMLNNNKVVHKTGTNYYKLLSDIKNKLKNPDGTTKEYIIGENLTSEQKKYNLDLYKIKKEYANFISYGEGVHDGMYHKLLDDVKVLRDKYMVNVNGFWIKKVIDDPVETENQKRFYQTYLDFKEYDKMIVVDGVPTGIVSKEYGYFFKREFVEILETANDAKKTSLVDPKWVKLMNPKTDKEKAESEFYKLYCDLMQDAIYNKIGTQGAIQWFQKNSIANIKSDFLNKLKNHSDSVFKIVLGSIKNNFSKNVVMDRSTVDENGNPVRTLPVLFMGGTRNQMLIDNLRSEIKKLDIQELGKKEYLKRRKELQSKLDKELNKPEETDLEKDLSKSLLAFIGMANNYEQLSNIESILLTVEKVAEEANYKTEEGKVKNAKDAFIPKRIAKYLEMVFYNDRANLETTWELIAKKIMNYTSLLNVGGFKIHSGINNFLVAEIANFTESVSGQYYSRRAAKQASIEFTKNFLPNVFKKVTSKDPVSKWEALAKHFHMVTESTRDNGRVDLFGWSYVLNEMGEFAAQSQTGMAYIMDTLVYNDKGESKSIYDAYEFIDGKLKLKQGFELPEKERLRVIRYIQDMNTIVHGNFRWESRAAIQQHWIGMMAMQFKKHLYPAFKKRFFKPYVHETLGEMEGQWYSVYSYYNAIKETEGNIINRLKEGWHLLSDVQQANIIKDGVDLAILGSLAILGVFLARLAEDVPEDDYILKRLTYYFKYQDSRLISEQRLFIPALGLKDIHNYAKNPMAITNTLGNLATLVMDLVEYPVRSEEENIIQKGPYEGKLKIEKDARKLLPGYVTIDFVNNLKYNQKFYIDN